MLQTQTRELTAEERQAIGKLLVETLRGELTPETRLENQGLPNTIGIPEPYGHLVRYANGYMMDNRKLANDLLTELRLVCDELQDQA